VVVDCFCGEKAVYAENKPLCKFHFSKWLNDFVNERLDKHLKETEVIAVAVSGGKDSTALLDFTNKWAIKNKKKLFAISIDEGIKGYKEYTLNFLRNFCKDNKIKLYIHSFKKETGKTLDELVNIRDTQNFSEKACTICGIFRRYFLNKYARERGATKILFAHNRDDEVQTFIMNLFVGNLPQMTIKGELGGIINHSKFVTRLKPLINIPEKALAIYSLLNYPNLPDTECPYLNESIRSMSRNFINELEKRKKGAKKNILEVYLKEILPTLKKNSKLIHSNIKECAECNEPSSKNKCNFCELICRFFV